MKRPFFRSFFVRQLFSRLTGLMIFHFFLSFGTGWLSFARAQEAAPRVTRIKLDAERRRGEIDPKIYGNFIEHLGRCIYGGIYDPESTTADERGFRRDVIEAAKNLKVTILRWPGGNFASGYHWRDGIGQREFRPRRLELAWKTIETNQVGTNEFIEFCRLINAEPYICVNLGTGSWDEARDWVEYCNVASGTTLAELRARHGYPEPHKVTYWALGNEMDGSWQMGHRNAEDYAKFALEAAKLMKWVDPSIKLVACGSSTFGRGWTDWNRTVLSYLRDYVDYIAIHTYLNNRRNDFSSFLAATLDVEDRLKILEGLILEAMSQTRRREPIYIAYDEYNVWYRAFEDKGLEETYNLEDALVIATFLNVFVRNAHLVKIANMAQLVNVIGPIRISENRLWLQTIYYPLYLFANFCHGQALQVYVDGPTYKTDTREAVPYLDVSAAFNPKESELVINVVNRNEKQAMPAEIISQWGTFQGEALIEEVNGPDIKAENSPQGEKVSIKHNKIQVKGDTFKYNFPAHSYTMIRVKLLTPGKSSAASPSADD
ncbi:MAG: alpha-N-arabinofuranosidase [Candidatus Aminicenantales bacterium]